MNFSTLLLPLIIILFAIPLFMGSRRQKRAQAQQQELMNSLSYGDRVMTTSGLYATVVSTSDESIDLEIAPGVVTSWLRAAVREKVADSAVGQPDESPFDETDDETYADHSADTTVEASATDHDVEDARPTEAQVAQPLEESSKKAR